MKNPIAAIITDTHLFEKRSKQDSLIDDNFELNKSLYLQSIQIVKKLGLNCLFHGGDIFHSRKAQTQTLLTQFQDILSMFSEHRIELIAISGNHDKTSYSNPESFLFPYLHHPYFNLIKYHDSIELTNDIALHLIPYFEHDVYEKIYDEHCQINESFSKHNVLLTHQTFKGSLLNSGKKAEGGLDGEEISKKFDLVLCGHLHDKHQLCNGKVQYIGASHQQNHGENDQKGITILYDDLSIEQIQLDFPKYVTYHVNPSIITNDDIKDLEKEKIESRNHICVVLTGTEEQVKSFNKDQLKQIGIKIKYDIEIPEKEELDSQVEPFDEHSIQIQFEKFCEKNNLNLNDGKKYLDKVFNV